MKWPWARAEEEIRKEQEHTEAARTRLKSEVDRLEHLLDRIESRLEKGVPNGN